MINPAKIEEIAKQVSDMVPPGLKNAGDEFERKVKQVIQAKLSQLDVVNREDFDVQTQVLLRTREKLSTLEQKVAELEEKLNAKD
ncbi:accessory factor UbiK family protein [Agarivorans aestuarii]|uniref:Ubiquinone biosynthesis accessory factor UbiK n=1 Tax=Agarivorans aestuarii TaxID=1563703 RepID=A0ABU7G5B3_9ALTE|nr:MULTISPECIES: accessory factor UbiK family protein [Agarivorans]MEE1674609.1 accessory factor UbiK family protein [Agarivorans aestuarii]